MDQMPPRRAAVLAEAMRGASLQEIGDRLGIKRSTVHSHLKAARRDLGAQTTVQAIGLAWVRLVTTPPPDLPTDSPDRVPVEVEDYLAVFTDALRGDVLARRRLYREGRRLGWSPSPDCRADPRFARLVRECVS